MADTHNVFIPHRHEDDAYVQQLKSELEARGVNVRDSSITSDKPNKAKSEDYIKREILAPGIQNSGKIIVLISPDTKNHPYVDWEVEYASRFPNKKIIGVWLPGADDCPIPDSLEKHGHDVVTWDVEKIIESMEGTSHWERSDGSTRPYQHLSRIGC